MKFSNFPSMNKLTLSGRWCNTWATINWVLSTLLYRFVVWLSRVFERFEMEHIDTKDSSDSTLQVESLRSIRIQSRTRVIDLKVRRCFFIEKRKLKLKFSPYYNEISSVNWPRGVCPNWQKIFSVIWMLIHCAVLNRYSSYFQRAKINYFTF